MRIKKAVKNIRSFEVNNITDMDNSSIYPSPWPHKSCMNLKMIKGPKFIYHDLGNYLVAYCEETGLVSSFEYNPRTHNGFAGREFILPIKGGSVFKNMGVTNRSYKGTLWDTQPAKNAADEHFGIKTVSVGYKTINDRFDCYSGCEINKAVYEMVLNLAGFNRVYPKYEGY